MDDTGVAPAFATRGSSKHSPFVDYPGIEPGSP